MTNDWLFLLGGLFAGGILAAALLRRRTPRSVPSPAAPADPGPSAVLKGQLDTVQALNRLMMDAADEERLISGLLDLVISASAAAGAAYIPLDELGQPLAQIQKGAVPRFPIQPWAAGLDSPAVKETCRMCLELHNPGNECCPLAENPFMRPGEVTCLPVERGGRRLGVINLFQHPGQPLDQGDLHFIQGLLGQVSLAVDNLRIHSQELAALRHLQFTRHAAGETHAALKNLLERVSASSGSDAALLTASLGGDGSIQVSTGTDLPHPLFDQVSRAVQQTGSGQFSPQVIPSSHLAGTGFMAGVAAAVTSLSDVPLGWLVALRVENNPFTAPELRLFTSAADQAGLLVENERRLVAIELRAVMEERARLAREIHDGLAQDLAFLKLQTAQMNGLLQRGHLDDLAAMIRANHQVLSDAYTDTRQAINQLRLSAQPGLQAWFKDVLEDFRQRCNIKASLSLQADPDKLPEEVQAQLIRILQEALNNIRKHAHANRVDLSFRPYQGDVILEIRDDGQGFAPEDIPSPSQFGLRSMRERAEMIGADFQVISQPEEGTTILVRLPSRQEKEVAG